MVDLSLRAKAVLLRRQRMSAGGATSNSFYDYQNNPVGFGVDVLKEVYTDDIKAVMESVRDNPITIARSANAVGKSHGAARVAIWFYKCFPGAQVYTTSAPPESNLKRILWGEIGSVIQKNEGLFKEDRIGNLNITRAPQEFITGVAIPMSGTPEQREAKFSGKHAPNLLFIVDEGDAVPIEVYKGIESCMSGGNARLLIMFNPRGQAGPVYNMERNKAGHVVQLSAFSHPNVISGMDLMTGAVTREKTVRRINEWSRPLMSGEKQDAECFQVPEFLVGAVATGLNGEPFPPLPEGWRKVTNPSLFYMVLGEYPAQSENQLISRAWIENAQARWQTYVTLHGEIPPLVNPVMGLDVAEMGVDGNVVTFRYGGFVATQGMWKGVDPDATAIKAASIYEDKSARICYVDATGVGAGVAPRMSRLGVDAAGVKVGSKATILPNEEEIAGEFFQLRDQLWWSVREWLRKDVTAMLPPDDDLAQELSTPTYAIKNGKIKVTDKDTLRELLGRSPDKADSLCLTFADDAVQPFEVGDNPFTDYRG